MSKGFVYQLDPKKIKELNALSPEERVAMAEELDRYLPRQAQYEIATKIIAALGLDKIMAALELDGEVLPPVRIVPEPDPDPDPPKKNPARRTKKSSELISRETEKFLDAAVAIQQEGAVESGSVGFFAQALTQCTLPHSKPADDTATYGRRNGKLSLVIQPGEYLDKKGQAVSYGVPYGSVPRLLLCWITSEATKTRSRHLILGNSLSEFMAALDLAPSWGRRGTAKSLTQQMERLFNCSIRLTYEDRHQRSVTRLDVAKSYDLFFHDKHDSQGSLWQSTLTLTKDFYDEIIKHPVPLDIRALKALKKSPLAIDLYLWLTYRMSYLPEPTTVSWAQLHAQFGSDYARVRDFKSKVADALDKLGSVYPEAKATITGEGLALLPSPTHVPKSAKRKSLSKK